MKYKGEGSSLHAFSEWADVYLPEQGQGLAVVAEPTSSPTNQRMRRAFMKKYPRTMWVEFDPLANTNERGGLGSAFGGNWMAVCDYEKADVIVSLDADFLGAGPLQVPNTRGWSANRTPSDGKMSQVHIIEPQLSVTGANADERLAAKPDVISIMATRLAQDIAGVDIFHGSVQTPLSQKQEAWLQGAADTLQHAGSHALVVAGASQPPIVHYLVARINEVLGAVGTTVSYRVLDGGGETTIEELATAMESGDVQGVIILGGNPAFTAPADLHLAAAIEKLPMSAHLSYYENETSSACKWHMNQAHWLEAWHDGRAADGTKCIGQPLIEPLFGGISTAELLAILAGETAVDSHTLVRDTFNSRADQWNPAWRKAVHDGVELNTSILETPPVNRNIPNSNFKKSDNINVVFTPSASVWDGRFANNGWLQELPDTITKLTWDNAAIISPKTATKLGVAQGDMVKVEVGNNSVEIAAIPVPGTADDVVVLSLGYGRSFAEGYATGAGVNVYPLRTSNGVWSAQASVTATGNDYPLATTQTHFDVNSTPGKSTQERLPLLFREGTLEQYNNDPAFAKHVGHTLHTLSMYEERQFEVHSTSGVCQLTSRRARDAMRV